MGLLPFLNVLTGEELLNFVTEHEDMPTPDLVKAAGYTRQTKSGKLQLLTKPFYDALLKARGVSLKQPKATGKLPTFETSVHESGIVLVGKTYTNRFGLQPGDVLHIELGESDIRLVPMVGKKATPKKKPAKKGKKAAEVTPLDPAESLLAAEEKALAAA